MNPNFQIFKKKKILITGFNGFKGTWLCLLLNIMGAELHGISLKSKDKNSHYNLIRKNLSFNKVLSNG